MKPNAKKNRDLLTQYPFLTAILASPMEPFGISSSLRAGSQVDDLAIHVEKADGELMFRSAHNVGLGDSSYIFQLEGARKDQVMRRCEYLFAIDATGRIINRVDWPRNIDEDRLATGEIYGRTVFWARRIIFADGSLGHADPIWDQVKYLVWVTVETWHTDTKSNDVLPGGRFGEFRDRSIDITIYGEPQQGFERLEKESSVYTHLSLDTQLMMRGVMRKDHDIISMAGMLYEMCILFQDEVYFNGMKDVLDKSNFRGASGQFDTVEVLCAEMCGYDRVMLEDATSYVTFQLRPDSKHMYVLGQQGTLPRIRHLVKTVVRLWNQDPALRAAFKPDAHVSVV